MTSKTAPSVSVELDQLCIDAIRILSMDAVQKANSGHPGTPMSLAPLAYLLYTRHMKHAPASSDWVDRDRFILSCGHASMLQYSMLYLTGYGLALEDLQEFRQWGSKTPGHPEYGHTEGVETTTGPLGQGLANAVGFAVAEARLAAEFNDDDHKIIDHHTWFIASDGDLMEGISHEAASYAGHLGLGKLIGFFDDNGITIDGSTDLSCSDDAPARFRSYGWQVLEVSDGNDLDALDRAIAEARSEVTRPSLIVVSTEIGWGSPNKQNTAAAHGAPLGEDEVKLTREKLGWKWAEPFFVPDEVIDECRKCIDRGHDLLSDWTERWQAYEAALPELAAELMRRLEGRLPDAWDDALPSFEGADAMATRAASGKVINAIAGVVPELVGGSADLSGSNNTDVKGQNPVSSAEITGRNFHFGIREHAMGAIMNGMALHGGFIPYGGTFLIFSDYMRPAIRLACLMKQHVIYVFTHDSIGLGEDGPTHQPVEQLAALRAIPGLKVMRPADPEEVAGAWRAALEADGPVALSLTRQKVTPLAKTDRSSVADGGYTLADTAQPDVVLIGTGSETELCVGAAAILEEDGVQVRVVSMPCKDIFMARDQSDRGALLPDGVPVVVVEAGIAQCWHDVLRGNGEFVGMSGFGASAPGARLYEEFGITVEGVVKAARRALTI